MKIKNLGIYAIIALCLALVIIWFSVRQGTPTFNNYDIATHSLGQLSGLIGMILFSLTMVLSTRLGFLEDYFGGLDKMYKTHHIIGALSFILLLFHPILLVLNFLPSNVPQAAIYLLPSSSWAVNLGIISLLAMILLIVLTFFISMKYQNWKLSHKWMSIVYFIALLHIFLVTTDISRYPPVKYYMIFISLLGGLSAAYCLFNKPLAKRYEYQIDSATQAENHSTILLLSPKKGKMHFLPGQFAFLRLKDEGNQEQHPFSIASSPRQEKIRLAIKPLGDYTHTIHTFKPGALVELEGPYGRFTYKLSPEKSQVWISGGIGITPFLSMLQDMVETKSQTKVDLYYCTRSKDDAQFLEELNSLAEKLPNKNVTIIHVSSTAEGRLNIERIKNTTADFLDREYLICGPESLIESISSNLISHGVSKDNIHREEFNFKK